MMSSTCIRRFISINMRGGRVVRWCWVNSSAGASYNLDYRRARAYCACSRCGWGLFGNFYSHLSFSRLFLPLFGRRPDIFTLVYPFPSSFSLSLWETARYRLKYFLKGPLNPKQPTTQINQYIYVVGTQ